jgi:serine/threonine protein kinase
MKDADIRRNPVEQLAEEFLERFRRGERPALSEYTRKHPELADEIRDLFPALVLMEEAGPRESDRWGGCGQATADGRVPERLGDYRILREVGRGGMGIVYEAVQEALGRHVALKVLPYQAAADPLRLQRFQGEARSAARLHHTNIVPVFDVGECGGVHYYAMQFIRGQSLDEVLHELRRLRAGKGDRETLSGPNLTTSLAGSLLSGEFQAPQEAEPAGAPRPPEVVSEVSPVVPAVASEAVQSPLSGEADSPFYRSVARVGLQVAEALAYAHGQKVLHRDIKPGNLLLDTQGTVWVTDFGLAKEEGVSLTKSGDLVGTLRYMAPERFRGGTDPRSDLYGLGMTLYEVLALRPAFSETDRLRLIEQIKHHEPPPPRHFDPAVPRDLETIVLKAIAKEPGQRYPSAAELAEDLRRFLADRPIRARRSSLWERIWRWCRRKSTVAGLTGLVVGLVKTVACARRRRSRRSPVNQLSSAGRPG